MTNPPPVTEDQIRAQLRQVRYPGFSRDIVSFGVVKTVQVAPNGRDVSILLTIQTNQPTVAQQINEEAGAAVVTEVREP